METPRTIWYDIRKDAKQASANMEISDAQGIYWVLVAADRLRMLHIAKRRSGAYLSTFVLDVADDAQFADRRYVELGRDIYDYNLDAGIASLSYYLADATRPEFTRIELFRSDPSRMHSRFMSEYEKPPRQRYFWREGSRLWFDKQSVGPLVPKLEAKLYTTLPTIQELDENNLVDEPLPFPKELLFNLKLYVLDAARRSLSFPGQYLINDGMNRNASMIVGQMGKDTSVNDEMTRSDANA